MAGMRHKARVLALQTLYEVDCVGHDPAAILSRLIADSTLTDQAKAFAESLVTGVLENESKLDALIQAHAKMFPVAQLPAIDRNIIRLAIYELLTYTEQSVRVTINEAVELAKAFGSESSPRFINGVLGAVTARQSAKLTD